VIGEPPSEVGAVHETEMAVLTPIAWTAVGAPGFLILGVSATAGLLMTAVIRAKATSAAAKTVEVLFPIER
jgi:hypothetical protein